MKKLYLTLILSCSLMLMTGIAWAADCINVTCQELGYTTTGINSDCSKTLSCPFDSTYSACITYRTFTNGSCPANASICNSRYKITSCKSGYTLSQDRTKCVENTYEVVLTEVGSSKLQVVKAVATITGLGTKEAKELVDSVPSVIKSGVTQTEAAEIKKTLEDLGARVGIKNL